VNEPRLSFFPAEREDAPAFVVFPGGGYQKHAEHEGAPVAQWLNALGIAAFVLHYRVHPDRHPLPLRDAYRALWRVRSHADRVGVLGFSAGGHLAACVAGGIAREALGDTGHPPDLAVLGYPVISMEHEPHRRSLEHLLGPEPNTSERRALSPELHASARHPPTFLWHTGDDPNVGVSHSLRLAGALAAKGVPVELHVFPRGGHGLGLAREDPSVGRWTGLCEKWLRAHGWIEA
jgi:acetyl esterase/lipase